MLEKRDRVGIAPGAEGAVVDLGDHRCSRWQCCSSARMPAPFLDEGEGAGVFRTKRAHHGGTFNRDGRRARHVRGDHAIENQVVRGDAADDERVVREGDRVVNRRSYPDELEAGGHRERAETERTGSLDAGIELIARTDDEAASVQRDTVGEGAVVRGEGQRPVALFCDAPVLDDARNHQRVQPRARWW
jgi:hypothetical protein